MTTEVQAKYLGEWFPAFIEATHGDTYDVRWTDGTISVGLDGKDVRYIAKQYTSEEGTPNPNWGGDRGVQLSNAKKGDDRLSDGTFRDLRDLPHRRDRAIRSLTGSKSAVTPHYSLIKALSAVQQQRGRFLAVIAESGVKSMDIHQFDFLLDSAFELDIDQRVTSKWSSLRPYSPDAPLQTRSQARDTLVERMFLFFDLDGDESIELSELKRFAQAPISNANNREAPKSLNGRPIARWKRELWDDVLEETHSALLRALGMQASAQVTRKLRIMWEGRPFVSRTQFLRDTKSAGINLSNPQISRVFEVADSLGTQTVDTYLLLSYCSLDPDLGVQSSFPVTFSEHQHRKGVDIVGLVLYIPFLILFTYYLTSDKALNSSYWIVYGISDLFLDEEFFQDNSGGAYFKKSYADINSMDEFWQWVEGPLLHGFWTPGGNTANDLLQRVNAPLGALKIKQKRININTGEGCKAQSNIYENNVEKCFPLGSPEYQNRLRAIRGHQCYPDWEVGSELKAPYDMAARTWNNSGIILPLGQDGPWVFTGCNELQESSDDYYIGKMTSTREAWGYDCGGYALVLPFDSSYNDARNELLKIKEGGWIDDSSRIVLITFFTFNANLRMFTRFQFGIEFNAGGSFAPTAVAYSFTLFDWHAHPIVWSFFLVVFFFVLFAFIAWFVRRLVRRTRKIARNLSGGWTRFPIALVTAFVHNPWYGFDAINYLVFVCATILRIIYMSNGITENAFMCTDRYPEKYEGLARLVHNMTLLDGANALLVYFRIFYFMRLHNGINMLIRTMAVASNDVFFIVVIFFIMFTAFGLCAHIVYGQILLGFRDIGSTFSSLARMLVGDFDYESMRENRRVFTPLFFIVFTIVCVFLLFNMVIAVLSEAFSEVKASNYDSRQFIAIIRHDPTVSIPPPNKMTRLTNTSIVRELKYQMTRFKSDSARHNPRIFWHEYLKLLMVLERGKPSEVMQAAITLMMLEFEADTAESIVPSSANKNLPKLGIGGAARYKLESLVTFLKREFGSRHTLVTYERLLIKIPALHLRENEQVLWSELLEYHHHWKRAVGYYATFDLPIDDRIKDIHGLLCGEDGSYETGDWHKHTICNKIVNIHHYAKFMARQEGADLSSSSESSGSETYIPVASIEPGTRLSRNRSREKAQRRLRKQPSQRKTTQYDSVYYSGSPNPEWKANGAPTY